MSVSRLERVNTLKSDVYTAGCLGCLVCPKQVKVEVELDAKSSLREIAEGVAPVHISGSTVNRRSECGLDAIHGICRSEDGIQELADFIADGGVDGVQIV